MPRCAVPNSNSNSDRGKGENEAGILSNASGVLSNEAGIWMRWEGIWTKGAGILNCAASGVNSRLIECRNTLGLGLKVSLLATRKVANFSSGGRLGPSGGCGALGGIAALSGAYSFPAGGSTCGLAGGFDLVAAGGANLRRCSVARFFH